jgi:hypothetical protein
MQTANAIRVQRHYQRRKAGRVVLPIEVDEDLLAERLIEAGLLHWHEAEDREAITRATERIIKIFSEESTQ